MRLRKSNFELLRIISMIFIIIWHIIVHGNIINNCQNETIKILLTILQYSIVVHVNCFVLVTGYFQSENKFKFKKLLSLILQVIFYSSIIYVCAIKLNLINNYNYLTIFDNMNLNAIGNYWFIKTYIILYIFSDYINKFINSLEKEQLYKFLVIGLVIFSIIPIISRDRLFSNSGYTLCHFIYMYMIGATLKKYPLKDTYHFKKLSTKKYQITLIIIFILSCYLNYSLLIVGNNFGTYSNLSIYIKNILTHNSLAYSNPLIIIQSVSFFELFKTFDIKSKFINFLSKYVLGVYLLHDNAIVRENIYLLLEFDLPFYGYKIFFHIFLGTILIFLMGIIVDILRDKLFKLVKYIITKKRKYYTERKEFV